MGFWSKLKRSTGDWDDGDIREELESHLEMEEADRSDRRKSRMRLGNLTQIEEESRQAGLYPWLESVVRDVQYGWRQIRKTPVLSAAVVLSLAIGLGANTAIFSLVDAALIRPLPVADPEQLHVVLWSNDGWLEGIDGMNGASRAPSTDGRMFFSSISEPVFHAFAERQTAFEELAGFAGAASMAISVDGGQAEQVDVQYVSVNFFRILGIRPAVGRWFVEGGELGGEVPVVVSHRYWTNYLGADPDVLNAQLRINNQPVRVIGVAPAGFFGLSVGQWVDAYAPLGARTVLLPYDQRGAQGDAPGFWWVQMLGRLPSGINGETAAAQATGLLRNVAAESLGIETVDQMKLEVEPAERGVNPMDEETARPLWILSLLVGVLLLVVCANVANLLLSRSVARQRELAVRAALGASKARLFRQQITESGLFAALGGVIGLGLGYVLARGVQGLYLTGYDASNTFDLHVDARILLFSAAVSVLTAFLFGIAPAVRGSRAEVNETLKSHSKSVTEGRQWFRKGLVASQFALCFTALVASGLLGRSLTNLLDIEVGFDTGNLSYATVHPQQLGYDASRMEAYLSQFDEALEAIPGVRNAAPLEVQLLSGHVNMTGVATPNGPKQPEGAPFSIDFAVLEGTVGEGVLETLGIPLLQGRTLEARDRSSDARVAVVDEWFASRYFPDENPVGKFFEDSMGEPVQVVGLVGDARYISLRGLQLPTVYRPMPPGGSSGAVSFAIRSSLPSAELAKAVRQAAAAVDPAVPVTEFHTQTELIDRLLRSERLLAFVSAALSIVALVLAGVGLGGLLIYTVAQRTNEIGVRMALGAGAGQIIRLVLGQSLWMVAGGIVVGVPLAYVAGRYLESTLFELGPLDTVSAVGSLAILVLIALLATWLPARRAAGISPVAALREE